MAPESVEPTAAAQAVSTAPKPKRGRKPGKTATKRGSSLTRKTASHTKTSSLTKTTRRISKPKAELPPVTMMGRMVNVGIVVAIFVVAMAIQKIVPTEPVTKVEAVAVAPEAPSTEAAPTEAPAAEPAATPAEAIAETPSEAPAPVPTVEKPVVKRVAKIKRVDGPSASRLDHSTPLNAGGPLDLDAEQARARYLEENKKQASRSTENK